MAGGSILFRAPLHLSLRWLIFNLSVHEVFQKQGNTINSRLPQKSCRREGPRKNSGAPSLDSTQNRPQQQRTQHNKTQNLANTCPPPGERHFCILLLPGKSMASDSTRTVGLALKLSESKTNNPPVPPGSRESFFAGPKKVTKERTCAALGMCWHGFDTFYRWYVLINKAVLRCRQ